MNRKSRYLDNILKSNARSKIVIIFTFYEINCSLVVCSEIASSRSSLASPASVILADVARWRICPTYMAVRATPTTKWKRD